MNYLIYVSSSARVLSGDDLKRLLVDIRCQYTQSNITGMMLYSDGTFFHSLEGEEDQLAKAFASLQTDTLQKGLIKLKSGSEDERIFHDWSMGFKPSLADHITDVAGFVDPFRWDFLTDHDQHHPAVNLLKNFVQYNLQY